MPRLTLCLLLAALAAPAQVLTDKSCDKLRSFVLPERGERRWEDIPWKATFWEGVVEAQELDRPILLWAMNGHPLALT